MRQLKIIGCTDSQMWYSHLVGSTVEFVKEIPEGYLSREPSGLTNVVLKKDAKLIDRFKKEECYE